MYASSLAQHPRSKQTAAKGTEETRCSSRGLWNINTLVCVVFFTRDGPCGREAVVVEGDHRLPTWTEPWLRRRKNLSKAAVSFFWFFFFLDLFSPLVLFSLFFSECAAAQCSSSGFATTVVWCPCTPQANVHFFLLFLLLFFPVVGAPELSPQKKGTWNSIAAFGHCRAVRTFRNGPRTEEQCWKTQKSETLFDSFCVYKSIIAYFKKRRRTGHSVNGFHWQKRRSVKNTCPTFPLFFFFFLLDLDFSL